MSYSNDNIASDLKGKLHNEQKNITPKMGTPKRGTPKSGIPVTSPPRKNPPLMPPKAELTPEQISQAVRKAHSANHKPVVIDGSYIISANGYYMFLQKEHQRIGRKLEQDLIQILQPLNSLNAQTIIHFSSKEINEVGSKIDLFAQKLDIYIDRFFVQFLSETRHKLNNLLSNKNNLNLESYMAFQHLIAYLENLEMKRQKPLVSRVKPDFKFYSPTKHRSMIYRIKKPMTTPEQRQNDLPRVNLFAAFENAATPKAAAGLPSTATAAAGSSSRTAYASLTPAADSSSTAVTAGATKSNYVLTTAGITQETAKPNFPASNLDQKYLLDRPALSSPLKRSPSKAATPATAISITGSKPETPVQLSPTRRIQNITVVAPATVSHSVVATSTPAVASPHKKTPIKKLSKTNAGLLTKIDVKLTMEQVKERYIIKSKLHEKVLQLTAELNELSLARMQDQVDLQSYSVREVTALNRLRAEQFKVYELQNEKSDLQKRISELNLQFSERHDRPLRHTQTYNSSGKASAANLSGFQGVAQVVFMQHNQNFNLNVASVSSATSVSSAASQAQSQGQVTSEGNGNKQLSTTSPQKACSLL